MYCCLYHECLDCMVDCCCLILAGKALTGGELKRVSVGMGMISSPHVLFLDEPTTGLDSSAAYSLVKFLSELSAATNVVIIMTIHQPAQIVFDMLQDLYLMEAGNVSQHQ